MPTLKALPRLITMLLAPRWVGRAFYALALISGLVSIFLALSIQFGLFSQTNKDEPNSLQDQLAETLISSDDSSLSNGDSSDGEDEEDDQAVTYDIPEMLNPTSAVGNLTMSMFVRLGLVETILPSYGLERVLSPGKSAILDDSESRISDGFRVPADLRDRVSFWFDIYTKYDSNRKIIHHSQYPWIIFKVIDVSMIINSETPRHLWMRRQRAERLVKEEQLKVLATLKRLASRRDDSELNDAEKEIASALAPLGGDLRKTALKALRQVRVQTGQRDFFVDGLQISSRYLGTMEKIFSHFGMPVELTRIPLVESSFNRLATSKVGASGIWQFMGGTGRKFMMVDGAIDERRSPLKATEAAAHLLKENHLILYRSWPLAVTAWNHGPAGLKRAISRAGSRDLGTIIARYRSRSFDFASANFYSEFLAALHAERYSDEIFGQLQRSPHEELQAVKLSRAVRFNVLLRVSGMRLEDFLAINPELSRAAKRNLLLPRGFRLHVPDWALENLDTLFALNRDKTKHAS